MCSRLMRRPLICSPGGTRCPVMSRYWARTTSMPSRVSNRRNWLPIRGLKSTSLYPAAPSVEPYVEIGYPVEAHCLAEVLGHLGQARVGYGDGAGGGAGVGRPGPELTAVNSTTQLALASHYRVHDPVLGRHYSTEAGGKRWATAPCTVPALARSARWSSRPVDRGKNRQGPCTQAAGSRNR